MMYFVPQNGEHKSYMICASMIGEKIRKNMRLEYREHEKRKNAPEKCSCSSTIALFGRKWLVTSESTLFPRYQVQEPMAQDVAHVRSFVSLRCRDYLHTSPVDLPGSFPKFTEGYEDILLLTDRFSKLTRAVLLKKTITRLVNNSSLAHKAIAYGIPERALKDIG